MSAGLSISRRRFLGRSAACAAAPYVLTSAALGDSRTPPASERIVMAAIGVGGQGTHNLKGFLAHDEVRMVAVCDADRSHARAAKALADARYGDSACAICGDFREILARDDVDAVSISTPDHWHTVMALEAARRGKDIYLEKPLTLTLREGRVLSDEVRRLGRVLQTGTQRRSSGVWQFMCELAVNGYVGEIRTIRTWSSPGREIAPQPAMPVPEGFDYDMWLGPAPLAPYTQARCHYSFRFIWDYSGGQVTNNGAHYLDIAQWALGQSCGGPVEARGSGECPADGLYNVPVKYRYEWRYANGTVVTGEEDGSGVRIEGSEGWLSFMASEGLRASRESLLRHTIGPNEIHLYAGKSHHGNFLQCVRSRRRPSADVEIGHRSASVAHLGNIALKLGRPVRWDPAKEEFVGGDDAAERLARRALRGPWRL